MRGAHSGQFVMTSAKLRLAFLALLWLAGFSLGMLVFRSAQSVFVSLMLGASNSTLSIVGLLLMIVLPFLITVISVYDSKPALLYMLCFLKAIIYAVGMLSVYGAYGSSGWLAQILLMFTENCAMICLWVLWIHCIQGHSKGFPQVLLGCLGTSFAAGLLDLFVVSPFTASVMII